MCLPEAMWLNVIQVEKAKHPMKQRIVLMERKNKKKRNKTDKWPGFLDVRSFACFWDEKWLFILSESPTR